MWKVVQTAFIHAGIPFAEAIGSRVVHDAGLGARDRARGMWLHRLGVVLLLVWLLGQLTAYTLDGLIHVLLIGAAVAFLVRLADFWAERFGTRRH